MYKSLVKSITLSIACGMLASNVAIAKDTQQTVDQLAQDLTVMQSVLSTALAQSNGNKTSLFRGLSTEYLAEQGVLFKVHSNVISRRLSTFSVPPIPPMPPITVGNRVIVTQAPSGHEIEEVITEVEHLFHDSADELREVSQLARELSWTTRDLKRTQQDLSFELRTADEKQQKTIKEKIKAVEKELAEQTQKREKISQQQKLIKQKQDEKRQLREAELQQAKAEFTTHFESTITATLCKFGGGLRALPNEQYVTFVLEQFVSSDNAGKKDKIYVFESSQIKKCAQQKISEGKLLSSAIQYQF
ncbi:MAG: hypothetical protein WA981_12000 [Glaciecola sp.]